jgi:hypothetical protein
MNREKNKHRIVLELVRSMLYMAKSKLGREHAKCVLNNCEFCFYVLYVSDISQVDGVIIDVDP